MKPQLQNGMRAAALVACTLAMIFPAAHGNELDDAVAALKQAIGKEKPHAPAELRARYGQPEIYARQMQDEIEMELSQGGENPQMEELLRQVGMTYDSDAVKDALAKIRAVLTAERAAQEKKAESDADAKIEQIKETVRGAKKAADLDALIEDTGQERGWNRGAQSAELQQKYQTLSAMQRFVIRWQDYLFANERGDHDGAVAVLKELISQNSFSIIPRSELLAMSSGTGTLAPAPATVAAATPQPTTPGEGIRRIIDDTKDLDGIPAALDELSKIQKSPGFAFQPWNTPIAQTMADLSSVYQTYSEYKAGLPVQFVMVTGTDSLASATLGLKTQLLRLALPRILQRNEKLADGETVDEYMTAKMAEARKSGNVPTILRITEVRAAIGEKPDSAGGTDFAATLMAAENQDDARQYMLAIVSYETALKSGGALVPAEAIGAKIEAIKAAHPEDYQTGLDLFLNVKGAVPTPTPAPTPRIFNLPAPTPTPISIPGANAGAEKSGTTK